MQRPPYTFTLPLLLTGLILCCLYFAADIIVKNMQWNDFLPRYIGCEALLYDGTSPYTESVRTEIMALNPPDNVEQRFSYPAHLCLTLAPLWLLPYTLAVRLWILSNFLMIGSVIWIFARLFKRRLQPLVLLLQLIVVFLGFRYSMMTVVLGQFTGYVMLAALVAAWALWRQQTWVAVAALVSLTIRPDGAVIMLLLSLFALHQRQWRPIIRALGVLALLWLITYFRIGDWTVSFINDTRDYAQYNTNVLWLPDLFAGWGLLLFVAACCLSAYVAWHIREARGSDYYVRAGLLALLMSLLLIPQTNPYTLVYALPGFFWLLHCYWQSKLAWIIWIVAVGITPWLLYVTVPGWAGNEQWLYPLISLLLLAGTSYTMAVPTPLAPSRTA